MWRTSGDYTPVPTIDYNHLLHIAEMVKNKDIVRSIIFGSAFFSYSLLLLLMPALDGFRLGI
jgi:hypothetical protein